MDIKTAEYKPLFKSKGEVTCLHTELFISGSLKLGSPIVLYKGDQWRSFIHSKKEQLCQKKGLKIFSDKRLYSQYRRGFSKYLLQANQEFASDRKPLRSETTPQQFRATIRKLKMFWHFYGLTEYSYHDAAYEHALATNNVVIQKHLQDLGELKYEARKLMNIYIFNDGIIHRLLRNLEKQFRKSPSDLDLFFSHELLDLYNGIQLSNAVARQRRQIHGCVWTAGKMHILPFSQAKTIWAELCVEHGDCTSIKGTIANPGMVSGRAIISPGLMDLGAVERVNQRMRRGDILIAESTTPELMPLCRKAAAIVTDQGGMLSHAAIVSRELKIPCLVGAQNATKVFKNGQKIIVDANRGVVKIIK